MAFFKKPFVRFLGWVLFTGLFISGYEYIRDRLDARTKAAQIQQVQKEYMKNTDSEFNRFVAEETKRIESTVQPGDLMELIPRCGGDTVMMQVREGKHVFISERGARWLPSQLVLCYCHFPPIRPGDPEWFQRARFYFSTQPVKP
jgi:hypothetical protein